VVSLVTDGFAADDIEATARRPGCVKRASTITGHLFLALVPVGTWSEATTTWAPGAAQVTPLDTPVDVSPAAIHQRLTKKAMAFRQDMIRPARANVQSMARVCDDGLLTHFPTV